MTDKKQILAALQKELDKIPEDRKRDQSEFDDYWEGKIVGLAHAIYVIKKLK